MRQRVHARIFLSGQILCHKPQLLRVRRCGIRLRLTLGGILRRRDLPVRGHQFRHGRSGRPGLTRLHLLPALIFDGRDPAFVPCFQFLSRPAPRVDCRQSLHGRLLPPDLPILGFFGIDHPVHGYDSPRDPLPFPMPVFYIQLHTRTIPLRVTSCATTCILVNSKHS